MDVHQMALLARQPSARVTERATFLGMPKRLLAVLLVNVMFWQPLWAQADGIAVSGTTNTQVGKAGNGVPVINIAAPNGAGLSHNQFKQYNVDRNGVILNNSTQAIQATQLGGNILGNDQLKGRAANTILNEVTGANATQLRGYTEVAGQSARVIVANPDGISCNGCGFINTPRVTLSTGKPELNASGKLERFAVDGGSVSIDGQGLDASRVDQFDIITRSAKINADIHAKQLNVIAGANDVDADTLATRARAGNPADKPQLAIDSSALGGMYADTIKLVGTERGVGVRTAGNLAASAGDIQLDANGHLNMAQASASGTLDIKAASVELNGKAYAGDARVRTPGELSNAQSLATRDSLDISAGSVRNAGTLAAGVNTDNTRNTKGDLRIDAAQVSNSGSLEASRRLSVKASEAVDNRAVMQAKTVELSTAQLTNQGKNARIVGEQALVLTTPAIINLEGVIRFGNGQDVSLQLDRLDNRNGLIQTGNASLAIKAKTVDNQAGQIDASGLSLDTDTLDNRAGLLSARSADARINVRNSLDNTGGTVQAQQRLTIDAGELINQNGRLLAIAGDLRLSASSLDNRAGRLLGAAVDIAAPGARIDNRGGKIVAERIDLRAAALDNREQGLLAAGAQGLALILASEGNDASQAQLLNRGGQLQSEGALALKGAWLDNSGGTVVGKQLLVDAARLHNDDKGALVSDGGDIRLNVGDTLSNLAGVLDAGSGALILRGAAAVDNQGGSLRGKQLDLVASSLDNRQQGQLVAGSAGLNYSGNLLNNDQGSVLAQGGQVRLQMAGGSVSNLGGAIQGDSVLIDTARLSNGRLADNIGSIASLAGDLTLNVGNLSNSGGQLFARYALAFQGDRLSNTGGAQLSGEGVRIAAGQLDNQGGLIEANGALTLSGATLDNRGGQLRALGNASAAAKSTSDSDLSSLDFSERIDNSNGRIAVGSSALRLKADALDNRDGSLEHAGAGLLTLDFKRLNGAGGSINALGSGDWQFGSVDGLGKVQLNKALTYTSDALALQAGDRLASGSDLTLNLRQLDNAGDLLSDGNLQLNLSGDLSNSGRLSAQRLIAIKANQLSQNGGRIGAGSDLRLELAGNLDNLGYLTARNTLSIDAARIDNRGTLGAQGAAILSASQSINNGADALLFSGGAMALRSAAVNNLYGDLYSVGDLSVAGLDGTPAQRFSNLSGTVESQGAITLNAAFVENAKAEFELGQTVVSGSLSWVCGQHCKGHDSFKRGEITIEQTLLETAIKDSPSARLVAGKDLTISADQVQNRYSLLAANGNLGITANDLLNLGASERTGHEITVIGTPGRIDTGYWDQMEYVDVPAFNAAVAAGNFDLARFELLKSRSADSRFAESSHDLIWTDNTPPLYAATLQAGGTVNLNVARSVQNGAVSEHNVLEILTGALGDDQTSAPLGVLELTVNKQADGANDVGIGSVTPVKRVDADGSVQTGFTPVDYSGIPFVSVDPTQGATFQLPKGEYGLFIRNPDPTSNYLIETNPKLTDLSQFLGSDYLLDRLKIDPDNNWRRLGDGLYEQRLIRDAVLAQTGQRFLANGLASDYDQYRYLMDNAVASKDALNLSLGVSLNAEQVGALTHDIVWMENRVVEGQKVLVPVLYLAKADARNVRGNSLIQGRDLNLISGGDLVNVGTLRASNDLNVASGASIYQGGLVEAGNNLQMLAQDSIRNAMAGEIRGERVSLTAVKGDILNERTAIKVRDGVGYKTFTDAGSGISARKDLAVNAGNDITNFGNISAGGNVALRAGNDVNLLAKTDSSEKRDLLDGGHKTVVTTTVQNLASRVTAGGDVNIEAARDINVLASQVKADNDLRLTAGQDITVSSAGDVLDIATRTKDGKKRISEADDRTTQVASELSASRNVRMAAGRDTNLFASKITAGNEAYLYSGNDLNLLAGENSTHTLYDMKEKGGWGSKKTQRDEVTRITNVGTEIKTGGDLLLRSEGDQTYQLATLQSGRNITLDSGGAVEFQAVKDLHQESHEKSNNNAFWVSSKGKGNTDETVRQSQLIAEGDVAIKAVSGLKIDINQVNQETVSQSIDAMVKADPQLAWLKAAEQRGDVDWRQVREIHASFKYSHSGLGPASQIIIAIVMAAVVGPMAAGAMGGATGGAVAAGTISAETAAGISAATGAVAAGAATNATVSVVNNRGNLGAVFKDVTSSDAMKGYVVSGATAGLTAAYFDGWTGTETNNATQAVKSPALSTWSGVGQFAANQTLQNSTSMLLGKALGQGGSGSDALKTALFNTLAAASFNAVGDYTTNRLTNGYPPKIIVHAMVGGLLAEATGGDFRTGALAAGVNEAVVGHLSNLVNGNENLLSMSSQVVGVIAAASQEDADASSIEKGGWVARNATQYNHALHIGQAEALDEQRKLHPERSERLRAAACALTKCAESIPTDHAEYSEFKDLQDLGATLTDEIAILKSTGQFEGRSYLDWTDDQLSAQGGAVKKLQATQETAAGLVGGVAGYGGMLVTSPACVGIVTCAAPVGLGAFGTASMVDAWDSAKGITADFQSDEPQRVRDSFSLETYPGERSPTQDLVTGAAVAGAEATVFAKAGKLFDKVAGWFGRGAKADGKDYIDILSPEAKQHILYGDKPGSGGHMWPGQSGKTVFPKDWSADKIVHQVGDIATSPDTKWYAQTGTGGMYTSKGDPAKWVAYEARDGVRIRVVYQPATGKVITAFPDNGLIPPYKPVK